MVPPAGVFSIALRTRLSRARRICRLKARCSSCRWCRLDQELNALAGSEFAVCLGGSFEKRGKVVFCELWLPPLGHGQEIASSPSSRPDLLQDRLQRRYPPSSSCRQGVFRFEPHRGNRVADFMGKARCEPANRGQPLGGAGAAALIGKARAGGVQCIHEPIQFALAGALQARKIGVR